MGLGAAIAMLINSNCCRPYVLRDINRVSKICDIFLPRLTSATNANH